MGALIRIVGQSRVDLDSPTAKVSRPQISIWSSAFNKERARPEMIIIGLAG